MRRKPRTYVVTCQGHSIREEGRTVGGVARKAFRRLIASGRIKRQPESTPEGGWKETSIDFA